MECKVLTHTGCTTYMYEVQFHEAREDTDFRDIRKRGDLIQVHKFQLFFIERI